MRVDRRAFLGALMGAGAYAFADSRKRRDNDPGLLFHQSEKKGVSILQGMTDETSAQFSIVVPKGDFSFEVARQDGEKVALAMRANFFSRTFSADRVHRLSVDGLELGPVYLLRVLNEKGAVIDEREFKALDLSARAVKAAFVSCQLDLLHRDDVWNQLYDQNPEIVFFTGDNVYADRTSFISKRPANEKQLWERYVLTRNRVAFYFHKRLRPVIATWDDHDYGADNQGRAFQHKEAATEIFNTFFAQDPRPSLVTGPGISRRLSAFGADFFMLDGRSFRDDAGRRGSKMLGSSQEKWLLESVQGKASWLLTGSMFFGGYTGKDSFEGYGADFQNFLKSLSETDGLFCFGSGDIHFSEVMNVEAAHLGYQTFELVSSSIHSYTFPGHEHRFSNPRRRASSSSHNFVIFEGTFEDNRIDGVASAYSSGGRDFQIGVSAAR